MNLSGVGGFIGRMFGNSSVPQAYTQVRQGIRENTNSESALTDRVELSANAPKPLQAKDLEYASQIADKLKNGEKLSVGDQEYLREDRVFAATVVLSLLGKGVNLESVNWSTGLPAPSEAEMNEAYRRVSQRLQDLDQVADKDGVRDLRRNIIDNLRGTDFGAVENYLAEKTGAALAG
jgi:hypothetical protein